MVRRIGTRRNLLWVLIAGVLLVAGSATGRAVAQGPGEQPLPVDPNLSIPALANSRIYRAAQWEYSLRAAPAATIPAGAMQQALAQTRAADAAQRGPRAGASADPAQPAPPIWTNVGPAPTNRSGLNVSGRITTLAVDPGNAGHWLAGGANGGLWSTTDTGTTWTPLTDAQASLASGAAAFAPSNPQVIYAGTGEPNASGDSEIGAGILKSTDGGATWNLMGASTFANRTISGLLVNPTNPNAVEAGSMFGFAGRPEAESGPASFPSAGLYASADGGTTWSASPIVLGFVSDLKAKPDDFTHQLLAIGNPFTDSAHNGLFRTLDGSTWTQLTGASAPWAAALLPRVGRIAIATSPSAPNTVYVAVSDAFNATGGTPGGLLGLWRSDNVWATTPTWTPIDASGSGGGAGNHAFCGYDPGFNVNSDQCWYGLVLSVDPTNANILYTGGIDIWKLDDTTAGTPVWTDVTHGIHVDYHALGWAGTTRLIVGNDGGVWSSTNGAASWSNHNTNLGLTQFYFGAVHPTNVSFALGGAQDNGTQKWTGTTTWTAIGGGDGILPIISNAHPDTNWAISSQDLFLQRTTNGGASFVRVDPGVAGTTNFVNVYAECPSNEDVVIAGTSVMNRANNFFSSAPGNPTWATDNSGSFSNGITAVAFSPSDNACNTYAFGVRGGAMRLTQDGGNTYTNINVGGTVPARSITAYAFDPTNANTLYVTLSGFNGNTAGHPGHIFKTANALAATPTWTDVSPPADLPLTPIVLDPAAPQAIYAGSDLGVWTSPDGGTTWTHFTPAQGMPNVAVYDLKLNRTTNYLAAFTHGRGALAMALPPLVLSFTTQPGGALPGSAFTTQPVVTLSLSGSTVTSFNGSVSLAIKAGTGTAGAVLGGTTMVNASSGVATFTNLSINLAGVGYVLTATGDGVSVDSASFVVGTTSLSFTTQPGKGLLVKPLPVQPVVALVDAGNNVVTSFSGQVTLTIKAGTGTAGATLGGTTMVNASSGVATFSNISISLAGTGYVLTASASGVPPVDSQSFKVLPLPDVNGDTLVNPLDALCVLRDAAGLPATTNCPEPYFNQHGDVNGDNLVNPLDALCVLRYAAMLPATTACPLSP